MSALPNLYDLLHSDFLHCPVCSETYRDPVILPCLHSACQACVQRHLDDTGNRQCPICQEHISYSEDNGHRPSIPPNHFLRFLLNLACCHSDEPKECDYCRYDNNEAEAIARCLECGDNMCLECTGAHHKTKVTRSHKTAPFKEIREGKYDLDIRQYQRIRCPRHKDDKLTMYCVKCDLLVCRECKIRDHEKHNVMNVEKAGETLKVRVRTLVDSVRHRVPGLEQYIQFVDGYQDYVQDMTAKVKEQVEEQTTQLHNEIETHKARLLQDIDSASTKELKNIIARRENLENTLFLFKSSVEYMNELMDHGKPEEILASKSLITERLTNLMYLQIEQLATKLSLYFTPGSKITKGVENLFGKVDSYSTPFDKSSIQNISKGDNDVVTSVPVIGEEVQLVQQFECGGAKDVKDIWPSGLDIDRDGQMVILDRENKMVKIFDENGKFVREFGATSIDHRLGCPYDVTILKNGDIAVSDYENEDLKIFTQCGEYVSSIKGPLKYPRGITCMRDGRIAVVDCHTRSVSVIDPNDGKVSKVIGGKDHDGYEIFTDPYYITTNHNYFLIVTDWAAPNIKIFDNTGAQLTKYGTYGSRKDQILQPYDVTTDSFGYIFVADNQNHRVHLLAPDGKFIKFLVTKQHGLWHPMAVCINPKGHLVITEALGKVKVFKYM